MSDIHIHSNIPDHHFHSSHLPLPIIISIQIACLSQYSNEYWETCREREEYAGDLNGYEYREMNISI